LDQKDFTFKSNPIKEDGTNKKPLSPLSIMIIVVAGLVIVGFGIYLKNKKDSGIITQ
jgi:hypothetical protein